MSTMNYNNNNQVPLQQPAPPQRYMNNQRGGVYGSNQYDNRDNQNNYFNRRNIYFNRNYQQRYISNGYSNIRYNNNDYMNNDYGINNRPPRIFYGTYQNRKRSRSRQS